MMSIYESEYLYTTSREALDISITVALNVLDKDRLLQIGSISSFYNLITFFTCFVSLS